MIPPTKAQHDAVVAATGRPYTADHMRPAKPNIDGEQSVPSLVDTYVNEFFGDRGEAA